MLPKCENCFETNWMGARKKAASHTRVKHREIAAASDSSLAYSHIGVKVVFFLFAVFKMTEIVLLFWKWASLSPSGPCQCRDLCGGGEQVGVQCSCEQGTVVFPGNSPPGPSHLRRKAELLEGK